IPINLEGQERTPLLDETPPKKLDCPDRCRPDLDLLGRAVLDLDLGVNQSCELWCVFNDTEITERLGQPIVGKGRYSIQVAKRPPALATKCAPEVAYQDLGPL